MVGGIHFLLHADGRGWARVPLFVGPGDLDGSVDQEQAQRELRASLVGFRPGEIPLKPGDLIARPRQDGITYDNAVAKGWFISHSDIVVEVDKEQNVAYVVGGNVGQSVSKAKVTVDSDGKLNDLDGWMVHIQNNIEIKTPLVASLPTSEAKVG
jgi:hypothetical protein